MADITFTCPHCNQAVQCDDQWAGHEIQCPICQGALVVPQPAAPAQTHPPVPKPPAGPSSKLSFQQNAQQPAAPSRSIPIRNLAPTVAKKKSPIVKIAVWAVVLAGWAERHAAAPQGALLDVALPQFERVLIRAALKRTHGHRQEAAKLLGWGRNTLTRKLKELGMNGAAEGDA